MSGMTKAVERVCLQFNLLAGAAADTNIAVTGIKTGDQILFACVFTTAAAIATAADLSSEVVILTDGNIQLTDTSTANNQILLIWNKRSV